MELQQLSQSRTAPLREVQRARILCRYHAGETVTAIARAMKTTRKSVRKWIDKALAMGAEAALKDAYHRPRAPVITEQARAWVVHLACSKPKELGYAAELWTRSLLAKHVRREAMQVYSSCQLEQNNPSTFVFFTRNASHGENYGLETQARWRLDGRWQLAGSAGLLHTRYLGYDSQAIECPGASPLALDGRAQSFAPEYKLSASLSYSHPDGWFARLDASATDGFYFAAGQNQAAQAYQLVNFRLGYQRGSWQTSLWTRNLLDRRYSVQGFYFGLVPPDFHNQRFIQNGDPRTVGLTVRYQLGHNED